jgi:hypothetical protein
MMWWGWLVWWSRQNPWEYERQVTRRLAWLCRYSHTPLSDWLACDTQWVLLFADCLAEIVEAETKPRK